MLHAYGTPPHVIAHCTAVADVAVKVAEALNEHDFHLNVPLILCAGMLHDIARKEKDHPKVGADYLQAKGLPLAADIVRDHMKRPITEDVYASTEADLVCLGDRTVLEDHYVGPDRRMAYIIDKVRRRSGEDTDKITAIILEKKADLKRCIAALEEIIGMSMNDLIQGGR